MDTDVEVERKSRLLLTLLQQAYDAGTAGVPTNLLQVVDHAAPGLFGTATQKGNQPR